MQRFPADSSNVTVVDQPCVTPAAPQITGPATVDINAVYAVTWGSVSGATEYTVEEATTPDFANASVQTVTGTSAPYTHAAGGLHYYYRVRARNRAGSCNAESNWSATTPVFVSGAPVPAIGVLVVVGSTAGNNGSYFRTALQLYNPRSTSVSGKIVFHPAGAPATTGDPSLAYSIASGKTLAFDDLLPAMGIASGIGSADLVADAQSPLPVTLARVFNDGGATGTTGLTEQAFLPSAALRGGASAMLLAPEDVQRFRLNVGARSKTASCWRSRCTIGTASW